jgi:hypothetical protein
VRDQQAISLGPVKHPAQTKLMQKITPFLWFDTQAEEAVQF